MNNLLRLFCCACLLTLLLPFAATAQSSNLRGNIVDTAAKPLRGIAVSLLNPADSTMAAFGVTDGDGNYLIQSVAPGNYVLQAAGMDFATHYQPLAAPVAGGILTTIRMQALSTVALDGVQVNGEKIPILLKKDTIEYNAGSFKTRPDAAVEDLLKKLPGVQVDKQGNIKAGGKDVQHVTVDGKEFFSNDPKVATKNLPADAIDKVQVFDGLSQSALYTGIDDGERDKTFNLKLKENKRKGYFGDVEAGGGTDERFKLAGHYYRFKKNTQLAALGAFNNINQMGFTMQDYFNFAGGLRSLLEGTGGGFELGGNTPSFGEQPTGLITSAAAGLNYTYESKKGRYNISFMGNGADKKLLQENYSQNFTDTESFERNESLDEDRKDVSNSLNYNLRHDLDSTQQLRLNGSVGYSFGNGLRNSWSESSIRAALLNRLDSRLQNDANALTSSGTLSWTHRRKGFVPVIRASVGGNTENTFSNTDWMNATTYFEPVGNTYVDNQYQRNLGRKWGANAAASLTMKLDEHNFVDPELRGALGSDVLDRRQGIAGDEDHSIDSLSPKYARRYDYLRGGLSFRHNTKRLRSGIGLRAENGWLTSMPESGLHTTTLHSYLLPSANLQYDLKTSESLYISYNSNVAAPSARQMLPATDYTNPLLRTRGNPALVPEEQHNLYLSFHRFDAFAFTSLMASLTGRYVHGKINPVRRINPDLSEDVTYANLSDDYNLSGRAEYNTPIRKLGINATITLSEQYNQGMNIVNEVLNINNTFTHTGKLSIDNRKKGKLDAELALSAAYTDAQYSVQQSLNTSFVQYTGYAQINYQPAEFLFFSATADIDRYQSASFPGAVTVPLLQASASYYFLKFRRAALTLQAFDLLDRNTSVRRVSQLNYLLEQRSNSIGRYFMLSFKYRLSATDAHSGGGVHMMIGG